VHDRYVMASQEPQISFTKSILGDKFRGDVVLTPCDAPYIFACGTDQAARNSCTSGNGSFSIQAGSAGALIGTSPDAPSITISSTITATNCGSEKTTIIGVGAGLGVGFGIAAIAAAVFFWQWRRAEREIMRRRRQFEDPANSNELWVPSKEIFSLTAYETNRNGRGERH
jgi:hypothetical protein